MDACLGSDLFFMKGYAIVKQFRFPGRGNMKHMQSGAMSSGQCSNH